MAFNLSSPETNMQLSINQVDLIAYIARQINNLFPDVNVIADDFSRYFMVAIERAKYCFSHAKNKYFENHGQIYFNHLHTDQYAMFLYYLSNSLYHLNGNLSLASKVYSLNKALHSVDLFYEVDLPDIFYLQHPIGTVLGRARYSNFFFVYQRCSIGANLEHVYPTIGEGVVMYGGSSIIGNCTVGENCWISTGTIVMDQDIPPNSVVFGRSPDLVIKPTKRNVLKDLFQIQSRMMLRCVPLSS